MLQDLASVTHGAITKTYKTLCNLLAQAGASPQSVSKGDLSIAFMDISEGKDAVERKYTSMGGGKALEPIHTAREATQDSIRSNKKKSGIKARAAKYGGIGMTVVGIATVLDLCGGGGFFNAGAAGAMAALEVMAVGAAAGAGVAGGAAIAAAGHQAQSHSRNKAEASSSQVNHLAQTLLTAGRDLQDTVHAVLGAASHILAIITAWRAAIDQQPQEARQMLAVFSLHVRKMPHGDITAKLQRAANVLATHIETR